MLPFLSALQNLTDLMRYYIVNISPLQMKKKKKMRHREVKKLARVRTFQTLDELRRFLSARVLQTKARWPLQTCKTRNGKVYTPEPKVLLIWGHFWKCPKFVRSSHLPLWAGTGTDWWDSSGETEDTAILWDCGAPTSRVGIILNIFKISGSHISYMMPSFLVDSWKAAKVMFCGKVNLADFLMRCLLSLEEPGAACSASTVR